jgi:hypothetical protein
MLVQCSAHVVGRFHLFGNHIIAAAAQLTYEQRGVIR